MSFINLIRNRFALFSLLVLTLSLTSFCTSSEQAYQDESLTDDERYLVEAYAKVSEARDHLFTDPSAAESLFARLDSTIDTLKISNTIMVLNETPDRWAFIFLEIENALQNMSRRGKLEDARGSAGASADVDNNDKSH